MSAAHRAHSSMTVEYDPCGSSAHRQRTKAKRFTSAMLHDYLRRLDVPVDSEPDWVNARIVQPAGVAE